MAVARQRNRIGPKGEDGKSGSQIYSVRAKPDQELGNEGDWAINTRNGDVFQKMSAGWAIQLNITGPKGPKGKDGQDGKDGKAGKNGRTVMMGGGGHSGDMNFSFSRSGSIQRGAFLLYEDIPSNVIGGHVSKPSTDIKKISFVNELVGNYKLEIGTHTGNMADQKILAFAEVENKNREIFVVDLAADYNTLIYVKIAADSTDKPKNAQVGVELIGIA